MLVSAFEDGESVVPVKLEGKEFADKQNSLYVAIALNAIKKAEVLDGRDIHSEVAHTPRSALDEVTEKEVAKGVAKQYIRSSNISISDLLSNVNQMT